MSWRVLTVFKDLNYLSADRGLELVASEFSLATGSWVRASIDRCQDRELDKGRVLEDSVQYGMEKILHPTR